MQGYVAVTGLSSSSARAPGHFSCAKLSNVKLLLPELKGGADSTILKSYLQVKSKWIFCASRIANTKDVSRLQGVCTQVVKHLES